jgi:hypothetical protein
MDATRQLGKRYAISSSCGSYIQSAGTQAWAGVTNLSVTLSNVRGGPVMVNLCPVQSTSIAKLLAATITGGTSNQIVKIGLRIYRDAVPLYRVDYPFLIANVGDSVELAGPSITIMDYPGAGSFTYYVEASNQSTDYTHSNFSINNMILMTQEI